MSRVWAAGFVFWGGFVIMVLEISGARFLARDFGSSFYVWISQIGVILTALAAGYYLGGLFADRFRRGSVLCGPLLLTGVFLWFVPQLSPPWVDWIVARHPADLPIPLVWQKLDPMLGSTLVFFLPCLVLALLCPYTVRLATRSVDRVGRVTGFIYAASTVGSIAGVWVSGYLLLDYWGLTAIFRGTGVLTAALGIASLRLDRWLSSSEAKG